MQYNLGYAYANGDGVAQNDAIACEWRRKAAEQGLAEAQARTPSLCECAAFLLPVSLFVWSASVVAACVMLSFFTVPVVLVRVVGGWASRGEREKQRSLIQSVKSRDKRTEPEKVSAHIPQFAICVHIALCFVLSGSHNEEESQGGGWRRNLPKKNIRYMHILSCSFNINFLILPFCWFLLRSRRDQKQRIVCEKNEHKAEY